MVTNPAAAPGELELVREFVNTLDIEDELDELPAWLDERGLEAGEADLQRAAEVREALRALLLANAGLDSDVAGAEATLDAAGRRARLRLRFGGGGVRLEPTARGVDGKLGHILAIVAAAVADGTWSRLKACRADDCRWAFYDHARNRTRAWCSMAVCGNRTKARAYRRRRREPRQREPGAS